MVRLINDDRIGGFNCCEIFFKLFQQLSHIVSVSVNNIFGVFTSANVFHHQSNAFDTFEEKLMILAAKQVSTVLQSNDVSAEAKVQGFNELTLALQKSVQCFV